MKNLVEEMNRVLEDWKEQYDLSQGIQDQFCSDENGFLRWNDRILSFDEALELEGAEYDGEHIIFSLSGSRQIYIEVIWPEDEDPRIHAVFFGYII